MVVLNNLKQLRDEVRHVTVVIDACFSGNIYGNRRIRRGISDIRIEPVEEFRTIEGISVFTAGAAGELAFWYVET